MKLYKDLMELPGISGHETRIRSYMRNYMKQFSQYEIRQDKLGSIFAYKPSKIKDAPTVMVAGHMDEVGLMVSKILPNGRIKVIPIGGLLGEVFISQVLYIYTKEGREIPGVIGSLPPHLKQNNKINIQSLTLDVGITSKEDAVKLGIALGDMVLFKTPFTKMANKKRFIAKAIDNRYGCALALETIKAFADLELPINLAIGATVQEEVGLRGAATSVSLLQPDVFIALDASPINDFEDQESLGALGSGFLLRIFDPRNIMMASLKDYFERLSKHKRIPMQHFVSMGGTDAARALDMFEGILSTTIGLPARYIHSTAAIADVDDIKAARNMLYAVLNDLSKERIQEIKEGKYENS